MSEPEWIDLLRRRQPEGMELLLRHYGPLMKYIIAPMAASPQDREDCLSEVTLRVWEKIGQFDPEKGSWTAWLTAVTRNTAWRYAQIQARHAAGELAEDLPSPEPTPEELTLRRERQEALRWAMKELRPLERQIFYRKYYYRQSTAQIAAELSLTERAVEGKLYRARQRLRKALGGGDGHA